MVLTWPAQGNTFYLDTVQPQGAIQMFLVPLFRLCVLIAPCVTNMLQSTVFSRTSQSCQSYPTLTEIQVGR